MSKKSIFLLIHNRHKYLDIKYRMGCENDGMGWDGMGW
jgi:hypothetical protein